MILPRNQERPHHRSSSTPNDLRIRLILLPFLGLATCAPPTPPAAPRVQREVPFTISTIGESWAITSRFVGTARVRGDRV